ncbi:UDP-N-acetylbacillosamine N-acetyltransferase [Clostridiales bacterium CHKCI001]|nr:UDP-N-acetylbacillosamine N-acetyltransferase [Clostridiales bacterium CHKCI001]
MILGIYGAGATGRSFMNMPFNDRNENQKWDEKVYVDDVIGVSELDGKKVYTFEEVKEKFSPEEIRFIIMMGEPAARKILYKKIKENGYSFYTYIDKNAFVWPTAKIGEGCLVTNGVLIDNNVTLSDNIMVYFGSVVGHDTKVGLHSVVSANAFIAGHCELGEEVYMGPGTLARDYVKIGEEAVLGLGTAVYKDVPAQHVAMGNPARVFKREKGNTLFR